MNEVDVKVNSFKAWILASRPKTLSGAAVPVMIGTALAMRDASFDIRIVPAVLCFLFAFLMQIDANFVNDYFDYVKGTDDENRLGPKRACAQGWITEKAMRRGMALTTVLSCMVGLPLVVYGGWHMIVVGAACVVFCFLYTTCLSYMGLGDVLVLLFFGFVPVCLTYYLDMPSGAPLFSQEVVWASLACGLVIDTLLVVNNYRDIDNDRRSGKKTLVVRIGARASEKLYLGLGLTACISSFILFYDRSMWAAFLPLVYLAMHISTYREMIRIRKGTELNRVLGKTARNMFVYGLLQSVGLIIA